jgi:DNA recombination protein Rad52
MSAFSRSQIKKLVGKLDPSRVNVREVGGHRRDYIEGWFAIEEANRIFGFAGWDREMAHFERVFERTRADGTMCAYVARVRIRVRAGESFVVREGTGFGEAHARLLGDAHERALKMAETDATKRALATFGNRFGLCLYDRERRGLGDMPANGQTVKAGSAHPGGRGTIAKRFCLTNADGTILARTLSAEGFCSGLRQLIEGAKSAEDLAGLKKQNAPALQDLRGSVPSLKASTGEHFGDILERLIAKRETAFNNATRHLAIEASPNRLSRLGDGPAIDKSLLSVAGERRIRSKSHLAFVASKACVICEDLPTHAHHLTFAQPRGLALKVSDEFAVPLCAQHHNGVHQSKGEMSWWRKHGIEPLAIAQALWAESLRDATLDHAKDI